MSWKRTQSRYVKIVSYINIFSEACEDQMTKNYSHELKLEVGKVGERGKVNKSNLVARVVSITW